MYPILQKKKLAENIYMMEIEAPEVAKKAKAGQFIIIRAHDEGERIPLTIANANANDINCKSTIETIKKTNKEIEDEIEIVVNNIVNSLKQISSEINSSRNNSLLKISWQNKYIQKHTWLPAPPSTRYGNANHSYQ